MLSTDGLEGIGASCPDATEALILSSLTRSLERLLRDMMGEEDEDEDAELLVAKLGGKGGNAPPMMPVRRFARVRSRSLFFSTGDDNASCTTANSSLDATSRGVDPGVEGDVETDVANDDEADIAGENGKEEGVADVEPLEEDAAIGVTDG